MKQAIITLKNGSILIHTSEYIWDYTDELNDDRKEFIKIGKYILDKDEIIMIEIKDINEIGENE